MTRATELYWSQHKVFFIATLALLPDKLEGHEVNGLFYAPFFASGNQESIAYMLEDYKNDGYLHYEKPNALYKITAINTQKALKDLRNYLKKWQREDLRILSANKPPDVEHQKAMLIESIIRARINHQTNPRITLSDVYGGSSGNAYDPPFWELALAFQLLDNKAEIQEFGYDQRDDGLYDDAAQPFVEYKITDVELLGSIVEPKMVKGGEQTLRGAHVVLQNSYVGISINGDDTYVIAKLGEDTSHRKFMQHLLSPENDGIDISLAEIKMLNDLKAANSLSELARYCGFTKQFKKAFFSTSKKHKIHFSKDAQLNIQQIEAIKAQAAKVEAEKS